MIQLVVVRQGKKMGLHEVDRLERRVRDLFGLPDAQSPLRCRYSMSKKLPLNLNGTGARGRVNATTLRGVHGAEDWPARMLGAAIPAMHDSLALPI